MPMSDSFKGSITLPVRFGALFDRVEANLYCFSRRFADDFVRRFSPKRYMNVNRAFNILFCSFTLWNQFQGTSPTTLMY